jgi:hypothetical protein
MLEHYIRRYRSWYVVVEEVSRLQVEQSLTLMSADVGLITIVTKPLTTALQQLLRCETTKRGSWSG